MRRAGKLLATHRSLIMAAVTPIQRHVSSSMREPIYSGAEQLINMRKFMPRAFAASTIENGSAHRHACWQCGSTTRTGDTLFCADCGTLQGVDSSQDYFSLMSVSAGNFDVSISDLEQQYKKLQRLLHPDKFTSKPEEERKRSADASSLINEAYNTLKFPLRRAEYMLKLRGLEKGEGTLEDPELLMEIMEARESIEETDDLDELNKLSQTFTKQEKQCIEGLSAAFANNDMALASDLAVLLRYISNIRDAISAKMQ